MEFFPTKAAETRFLLELGSMSKVPHRIQDRFGGNILVFAYASRPAVKAVLEALGFIAPEHRGPALASTTMTNAAGASVVLHATWATLERIALIDALEFPWHLLMPGIRVYEQRGCTVATSSPMNPVVHALEAAGYTVETTLLGSGAATVNAPEGVYRVTFFENHSREGYVTHIHISTPLLDWSS